METSKRRKLEHKANWVRDDEGDPNMRRRGVEVKHSAVNKGIALGLFGIL